MAEHHERAVALAREGRWDEAHRVAQAHDDALSCRIHGLLHRVEGDLANARYWYGRAGAKLPDDGVDEELARLDALARAEGEAGGREAGAGRASG